MRSRRYVAVAVTSGLVSIAGLAIVAARAAPIIDNVVMVIAGLFAVQMVSTLNRLLSPESTHIVQLTFNETNALDMAAKQAGLDMSRAELSANATDPDDVALTELLGRDSSLALAKLRIDIERELRRVAISAGLDLRAENYGVRRLAEELTRRGQIDRLILTILGDILPAANQAVHGAPVSDETAAAVIRSGSQLIAFLRATTSRISERRA
jgi:hypothetical protein